jgi:hypothetical protein
MNLQEDLAEFVRLLSSNEVSYVVVGAHALAFHGHPRFTADIDFFVERSEENAAKLVAAINAFGFESVGLRVKDFTQDKRVIQLGVAPNRIDLLTSLTAVTYEDAYRTAVEGTLGSATVKFLSRELFIANKEALGRPQDLADVGVLKRRVGTLKQG